MLSAGVLSIIASAALCLFALVYIVARSHHGAFSGDPTYMLMRVRLMMATVAIGYFMTLLGQGDITRGAEFVPSDMMGVDWLNAGGGGTGAYDIVDQTSGGTIAYALKMIGAAWFAVAIACLPFTHTVTRTGSQSGDTSEIDIASTQMLENATYYIYVLPLKIVGALFALTVVLFVMRSAYARVYRVSNAAPTVSLSAVGQGAGPVFTTVDNTP